MSLSRIESRRNPSSLSMGRLLLLAGVFAVVVAVSFVAFIRHADADYRREEHRAIALAKSEGGLTAVTEAEKYTWDETVWVVRGTDASNQPWILWERKDGIVKMRAGEGWSESRLLGRFATEHPGVKPIRVLTGWFQGAPAWEVRYWSENGPKHQAIDFYDFRTGEKLKTYDLAPN